MPIYSEDDINDVEVTTYPKETYWVDIPDEPAQEGMDQVWKNVASFSTKEEAIEFARIAFGADEEGMVSLVSS